MVRLAQAALPIAPRRRHYRLLLLAYCCAIFLLSSQPVVIPGPDVPFKDKLLHFIAYALMALLAYHGLTRPETPPRRTAALAFLFVALFALSDEWHQSFVPGRIASLGDWLADIAGAGCALLFLASQGQTSATADRRDASYLEHS